MRAAIIPARGGSKRIPRKNVIDFCGRPMIAWSILAARESALFDRIIVSTDDAEIAQVARDWGAEVPFTRPAELSDDHAGTAEVIGHAVHFLDSHGVSLSAACCIYATAPLLDPADLRRGWETLESGDWQFVFSVAESAPALYRALELHKDGGVSMLFPEYFATRTQDLPQPYHDAAQFYWGRPRAWTAGLRIFDRHSAVVAIPASRVQDIDSWDDLAHAKRLFETLGKGATE